MSAAEGRRFGGVVGAMFVLLGGLAWWRGHPLEGRALAGAGLALVAAGLVVPARLGPLQRAWMGLAAAISKITTPVFLGAVYFCALTPTGLLMRLLGRNPLARRRTVASFWVPRQGAARQRTDMEHQF